VTDIANALRALQSAAEARGDGDEHPAGAVRLRSDEPSDDDSEDVDEDD
jgi:hypothetical protein